MGAVWAVLYKCEWPWGPYLPTAGAGQTRTAAARSGAAAKQGSPRPRRCGGALPGTTACLPTAHSPQRSHLASVWLKPAAVAIRQSGRSGLLCGVVGEPHKRQARERARSRCNDHGARRMRGKRAVSKAGLCRRQQAGCMGRRCTSKSPRSDKKQKTCGAKRPRVYVCACSGGCESSRHQPGAVGAVGDGAQEPRGQLPPVLGGQN